MSELSTRSSWERLWQRRKRIFYYKNILEIATEMPLGIKGASVLEVGCGRGATLLEFAKLGALVTGVDYANSALVVCRELQKSAIDEGAVRSAEFVRADAEDLPFDANTFDLVYSIGVLEHFQDPMKMLAEKSRVLKPGGFLILQVPQKYSAYTVLKKLLISLRRWPYGDWETQYSGYDLRVLARRSGLSSDFTYGYGSFALAIIRHFFMPTLNHGCGGWHRDDRGPIARLKANLSLDVGLVAHKQMPTQQNASD